MCQRIWDTWWQRTGIKGKHDSRYGYISDHSTVSSLAVVVCNSRLISFFLHGHNCAGYFCAFLLWRQSKFPSGFSPNALGNCEIYAWKPYWKTLSNRICFTWNNSYFENLSVLLSWNVSVNTPRVNLPFNNFFCKKNPWLSWQTRIVRTC